MNAQEQTQNKLMYTLKAGVMPHSVHKDIEHDEDATESKIDWMAEFGLEIPVGKNWNIETALRYKSKSFIAYEDYNFARLNWNEDYLAKHPELDHDSRIYRTYSGASILELPIRTTYKLQLNDNLAFHLGVGPYASINLTGKPFDAAQPFKSSALTIGIESAVALYYKNVSIGATYNNPVFYQSNKVKDNNMFMITIGFRFDSRVWKSIGHGVDRFYESGAANIVANMANELANTLAEHEQLKMEISGSGTGSGSDVSTERPSSTKSSSSKTKKPYSISEQNNYDKDKETWGEYDSYLANHFSGSRPATRADVQYWQSKMKDLRKKWKSKGKSFPNSDNETRSISSCPNTSHSH